MVKLEIVSGADPRLEHFAANVLKKLWPPPAVHAFKRVVQHVLD
jgi:hypothetical protein